MTKGRMEDLSQYALPAGVGIVTILAVLWASSGPKKKKKPAGTKAISELPRPSAPPLIGHVWNFSTQAGDNLPNLLQSWAEEYNGPYALDLPTGKENVVISSTSGIKFVHENRPEIFKRDERLCKIIAEAGYTGIFTAEGEKWKRFKRVTSPALGLANVEAALPKVANVMDRMVAKWEKTAVDAGPFDIVPDITYFGTDVISLVVAAYDLNCLEHASQQSADIVYALNEVMARGKAFIPLYKIIPNPKFQGAFNRTTNLIQGILDGIKKNGAGDNASCLVAQLLENEDVDGTNRNGLSQQDIVGQAKTMFVAGADTVSAALEWVLYDLASNPECQAKLRDEIIKTVGLEGTLTAAHTRQMPYLESVIFESNRIHYPGGFLVISTAGKDTVVDGIFVPKGTDVWCLLRVASRSGENFTRARDFWPERWIIASSEGPKPPGFVHNSEASIPFGRGKRECPGKILANFELKVALSVLLRKFTFEWPEGQAEPKEMFTLANAPDEVKLIVKPLK